MYSINFLLPSTHCHSNSFNCHFHICSIQQQQLTNELIKAICDTLFYYLPHQMNRVSKTSHFFPLPSLYMGREEESSFIFEWQMCFLFFAEQQSTHTVGTILWGIWWMYMQLLEWTRGYTTIDLVTQQQSDNFWIKLTLICMHNTLITKWNRDKSGIYGFTSHWSLLVYIRE